MREIDDSPWMLRMAIYIMLRAGRGFYIGSINWNLVEQLRAASFGLRGFQRKEILRSCRWLLEMLELEEMYEIS